GDLAQRLGVRAKTLRDWENDASEPRANRLQMLAALLGVSLRWLLTGEGDDVVPPEAVQPEENPQLNSTLAELRTLRADLLKMGEKLGRLEKSLRVQMTDTRSPNE
ncbi:MAG: helix-turn-helix domain-containing protein, partial [Pararhodobacter sp.]|nr:helix-turn-helix domain-containing protein [Pararhodobacter sp.]